jgi:uncharacterized delta-60 repeat protein
MTTQNTAPLFKSGTGIALIDFDSSHDESVCSIIQSEQKIIVVGSTIKKFNDYTHYTWNFALTRLTKEGLIDSSFGNIGKTITDINSSQDFGSSALVDNYGNIFVAGSSSEGSAIVSYKSNGQLNESFNQNGKINNIAANGGKIAIQSDGMLLIAGSMTNNVKLYRYKSDGSLDLNFGVNGATSSFYDTSDQYLRKNVNGLLIQSDGKIVVESFGDSGYDGGSTSFNLTRFKSNGDLDSTFGVNGMVTTMIPTYNSPLGLTIQADGKLLVTGRALVNSVYQLVLLRYNSNGTLDDSFGINGKVMTSTASSGGAVCIQSDGKILVAGGIDTDFELIRFNINGTIDDSFGQNGLTKTDLGNFETVKDITILPTGKILVTGYSRDYSGLYSDFAIVRYNENGTLDKTFSPKTPFSTTLELLENNGFIKLDGNLGIYDSELANINDYAGSSVSLLRKGGANPQDIFSSTNNLSTLTEGKYFSVDGITLGRVVTNSAGKLVLTFLSGATQNLVDQTLSDITYTNTSDNPPSSIQIQWTFDDGNAGLQGTGAALAVVGDTTINITKSNDFPIVSFGIPDQNLKTDSLFIYAIPDNTFFDPDLDTLSYSVKMTDGTAIPPWLSFNSNTHTFSGTPSIQDLGSFELFIIAKDGSNASTSDVFRISVLPPNSVPTGSVTITGLATQNQTLTANNTLADADGLGVINYQWFRDDVAIANATQSNYTLTQTDVGNKISVKAGYIDAKGVAESSSSASTASVTNINDTPSGNVTITGTSIQNQTLTANNTLADLDGLGTITYQWMRDGAIINNAIYSTYPLTQADVGKAISVKANYTDLLGTEESVTSAPTIAVTSTGTQVTSITKVLLGFGDTFVAASNVAIFGNSGFETVKVQDGVVVTLDGNIERVEFARPSSSYTYQATPTGIDVLLSGNRVASVVNGEKLSFTNGSAMVGATFTSQGLGFTLGGSSVSTTAGVVAFTPNNSIGEASTLIAATPVSVTLNANSTSVTATSAADIFNIASGSYKATIAGFKPGDKLKFFAGAAIVFIQDNNQGDGYQEISATDPNTGATAIIALTGLTSAQDDGAFNVPGFNNVFGSGSLV